MDLPPRKPAKAPAVLNRTAEQFPGHGASGRKGAVVAAPRPLLRSQTHCKFLLDRSGSGPRPHLSLPVRFLRPPGLQSIRVPGRGSGLLSVALPRPPSPPGKPPSFRVGWGGALGLALPFPEASGSPKPQEALLAPSRCIGLQFPSSPVPRLSFSLNPLDYKKGTYGLPPPPPFLNC